MIPFLANEPKTNFMASWMVRARKALVIILETNTGVSLTREARTSLCSKPCLCFFRGQIRIYTCAFPICGL
jgi:hypothetical protein